jgi:superoxide dismutase
LYSYAHTCCCLTVNRKVCCNADAAFGSLKQAKAQFSATALGVSAGWAWLVVKDDGNLTVTSTPDHVRRRDWKFWKFRRPSASFDAHMQMLIMVASRMNAVQDNPLQAAVVSQPGIPVLGGLDMWEHSHYLKCASCT